MRETTMYVDFMIRRRAKIDETIPSFNQTMVSRFRNVPMFWNDRLGTEDPKLSFKGESGSLPFETALLPGLTGQILYAARFRAYLDRDEASADDFVSVRLDTSLIDYKQFCNTTLPSLIRIFEAYRCKVITDKKRYLADWEITRNQSNSSGRNIDGRDSVYRVWPVNYFDDLLCQRSFGVGAEEVVRRAAPACERAELVAGGAFLIVTTDLIVDPDLDALNARMMALLDTRDPASLPPPPTPKPRAKADLSKLRWVRN